MATFNYILGRKKDNGKYPIYLRITHRNKNTSLSLDIEVAKTEWSTARQRIKKSNTDYNSASLFSIGVPESASL